MLQNEKKDPLEILIKFIGIFFEGQGEKFNNQISITSICLDGYSDFATICEKQQKFKSSVLNLTLIKERNLLGDELYQKSIKLTELYIINYLKKYQDYKNLLNYLRTAIQQNYNSIQILNCPNCKKQTHHFIKYEEIKLKQNNFVIFNINRTFLDQNLHRTDDYTSIEFKEIYQVKDLIPNAIIYNNNEEILENQESYSFVLKGFINREGDEISAHYTCQVISPIFTIKALETFPLLKQIYR